MFILPRRPDGTKPKLKTNSALFAFVCLRLASIPERAQTSYLKREKGVNMSGAVARQVGARRSWSPAEKRPTGPSGTMPEREDEVLRSWLLVDEAALGLKRAIVRFPGEGARQLRLLRSLRELPGVRQVFETRERRDVHAIVLFHPDEEEQLLASLEGLGRCFWSGISHEDSRPALRTWSSFLKRAAHEEGLLTE
jgi:hypothetical protein